MLLLNTLELVDITKEIPLKYWIIFIAVMAVVLSLVSRYLTNMFIPKDGEDDAPVWSAMSKKDKWGK